MFTFLRGCSTALAVAAGSLMFQAPAFASPFNTMNPVSDEALADIRGGFSASYDFGRLRMALDITRSSLISGLMGAGHQWASKSGGASPAGTPSSSATSAGTASSAGTPVGNLPDAAVPSGTLTVMQSGFNNRASQPVVSNLSSGSTNSMLIQNSSSNRTISYVNTVNITVTSQALAQAMAMQSLTQGAILKFLR